MTMLYGFKYNREEAYLAISATSRTREPLGRGGVLHRCCPLSGGVARFELWEVFPQARWSTGQLCCDEEPLLTFHIELQNAGYTDQFIFGERSRSFSRRLSADRVVHARNTAEACATCNVMNRPALPLAEL